MRVDLDAPVNQATFAVVAGVSEATVSELKARGVLVENATLGRWIIAYYSHLREQAAGRQVAIDVGLTSARAKLANEQADRVAMQNAITRREYAPVAVVEEVLAKAASRVAGIFDGIPGAIRRRAPDLPADMLVFVEEEIARARNVVATISMDDLVVDPEFEQSADLVEGTGAPP